MKALKIALLSAAASFAMGGAAFAQDDASGIDFSFNVGAASDYIFRGYSQTDENGQVFAGADVTSGMLYAGVWASNVDFLDDTDAEIDVYAGVRPTLGPVSLDFGALYYGYVDAPGGADYDYWEFKAAGSIPAGPATFGAAVFYSPDFFGAAADEGLYYEVNGAVPVYEKLTLSGALGRQEVDIKSSFGGGNADYTTWNLGLGYAVTDNFGLDLRYWDTDEDESIDLADERVVLSLKVTMP